MPWNAELLVGIVTRTLSPEIISAKQERKAIHDKCSRGMALTRLAHHIDTVWLRCVSPNEEGCGAGD